MRNIFVFLFIILFTHISLANDNLLKLLNLSYTENHEAFANLPIRKLNTYDEVVRKIPQDEISTFEKILDGVDLTQLNLLNHLLMHPQDALKNKEFIKNELFPYVALKALKMRSINGHPFGTLMLIHSLATRNKNFQFIPLFDSNRKRNDFAQKLMSESTQNAIPPLILYEERVNDLYLTFEQFIQNDDRQDFPPLEQGFILVTHNEFLGSSIQTRIYDIGFSILSYAFDPDSKFPLQDIIPSLSLMQTLLNSRFGSNAVRLNVVLGNSSLDDLWIGAIQGYRDIAVPFPKFPLPKMADHFPVLEDYQFTHHDFYHSIRLSMTPLLERNIIVKLGHALKIVQNGIQFEIDKIKDLEQEVSHTPPGPIVSLQDDFNSFKISVLEESLKRKISNLNLFKERRKAIGRLKFLCWDLERRLASKSMTRAIEVLELFNLSLELTKDETDYLISKREQLIQLGVLPKPSEESQKAPSTQDQS